MTKARRIVFSPHCDDAAYSLGGGLLRGSLGLVHIVNMFTLTYSWVWNAAGVEEVTAHRKSEEEQALAALVGTLNWEDLPDVILRDKGLLARLWRRFRDRRAEAVLEAVLHHIDAGPCDVALFPAGEGDHPDHILLAGIGLKLADSGIPVLFYLDQPYGADVFRPGELKGPLAGEVLEFRLLRGAEPAEKERLIYSYRSQVYEEPLQNILRHYRMAGGEILMARQGETPLLGQLGGPP
jgi:LmbE family N-acetylglucosaminyl deacetylase